MKDMFTGYYPPGDEEYKRLWKEGLIVLDTNVLLDLYRLPATARDELLDVLESLNDRLWIPYQVALEFQRRRLTVIASERKAIESALQDANDLFEDVQKHVAPLQIDKRGLGISISPILAEVKAANAKLSEAMNKVHRSQLDIAIADPIRDRLDQLLDGKVGAPPANQAELDELCADGEERYCNQIPPGFEDAGKEKNPNEATFFHDGIRYERKFGDLIFWRQLIGYTKANQIASVLLITSDQKEDWWWREKGKTIGPRPELGREIEKLASVNLFWMYTSSQFLQSAKTFTKTKISPQSVSELEEISRTIFSGDGLGTRQEIDPHLAVDQSFRYGDFSGAERAVRAWLERKFGQVRANNEFPDFTIKDHKGLHGYEVKFIRHLSRMLMPPPVINAMLRGYFEINEGRLSAITIVLVADQSDFQDLEKSGKTLALRERIDRLMSKYPVDEIIIGYVDGAGIFKPAFGHFLNMNSPDWPNAESL